MNILIVALAPVVVILIYVYLRDKYDREPAGKLFLAFFLGALSVIPVLLTGQITVPLLKLFSGYGRAFYEAFFVAAVPEEGFKFLFLYLLIWRSRFFSEKFDGIVYAVFLSLGFAAVENIMYVTDYGYQVGVSRAFTAVPGHALFGVAMGYHMGIARMYHDIKKKQLLLAFMVPVVLHGIYDFILMSEHEYLIFLFVPYLVYLWRSGFRRMKVLSDSSVFRDHQKGI